MQKKKFATQEQINSNNYLKILSLCCLDNSDSDERIEWLKEPFSIGDNIYSTNKYVMVYFNKSNTLPADFTIDNLTEERSSRVIKLVPEVNDEKYVITIDQINTALSFCIPIPEYETVGRDVICSECSGEGYVEWHYEGKKNGKYSKEFECPVCGGEGLSSKTKKVPTGGNTFSANELVKFGKCYFSSLNTNYIKKIAELLGEKEVYLISQKSHDGASLFRIGDVSLIIMPLIQINAPTNIPIEIKPAQIK